MRIEISNKTELSNKQVRLIRWRIQKLYSKFKQLLYVNVFLKREGREYQATVKLGVRGKDIVIKHKSDNIYQLMKDCIEDGLRYLRKYKERRISY